MNRSPGMTVKSRAHRQLLDLIGGRLQGSLASNMTWAYVRSIARKGDGTCTRGPVLARPAQDQRAERPGG